MGLTTVGANTVSIAPLSASLNAGGVFIVVALLTLLAYRYVLGADIEQDLKDATTAMVVPLLLTFEAIVVFKAASLLGL